MATQLIQSGQKEIQMIVFRLGLEDYAVPITAVQEIIMPQKPTRIPKAPSFVEGIINLRGHIIPVIDGRRKFNLFTDKYLENKVTEETRIMLLEVSDEIMGLIVDQVSEVIHLQADSIEPPPADVGIETDYLYGIGKHENKLLILLNIENFLTVTEADTLKDMNRSQALVNDKMLAYSGE